MADLTITAASVIAGSGAKIVSGTAGASITAGQVVYKDTSDSDKLKLADNDSATAAVRSPVGIALHAAASGQPLSYVSRGPVTIGATIAAGGVYSVSSTPGGICPVADIATGDYNTVLGVATSTTVLDVLIHSSGVVTA
jgi:hypothetical protein